MAGTASDLQTIQRLSQYRPFEKGGQTDRERKEDLILAGLAEAGGSCTSLGDCAFTLTTLWGLQYDELELADPMNHLIAEHKVVRDNAGSYALSPSERASLEQAAQESRDAAHAARAEWHASILDSWPLTTADEFTELDAALDRFLQAVAQQHGAEAALLLYPDEPGAEAVLESADAKAYALSALGPDAAERAEWALSMFMREATAAQRAYLSQIVNTAYFTAALTLDPEGARLIQAITSGQRVYLDTNFVYRLLGVQGPRYVRAAESILRATQAAGYVCAVTPWTTTEYRESLERSRQFLQRYPIPPDEFAALAADVTSVEDFVTSYWRQVKTTHLSVTDYVAYHTEVASHLQARGVAIVDEGCKAIDAQPQKIEAETAVLVRVLAGKWRHPELIEHDVKHRLLIERLRGAGNRTFANAGYWFLTHDKVLPRYDAKTRSGNGSNTPGVPFCVSAGAWFQVVEAFNPKTSDFEQTLADVIASPYIHPRVTISKEAAQAVVARVAQYSGGSPEVAARVFLNSAAMAEIERAKGGEQVEVIDNAVVAAAKAVQEEARAAMEEAKQQHEQDQARIAEAEARAAQKEREKERALADAEFDAQRELRDAQRRHEAAMGDETARREADIKAAEQQHQARLREQAERFAERDLEKDRLREDERRKEARFRRRLRLLAIAVALVAVFMLLGLAVGVSKAWAYIAVVAVILGVFAAVDQMWKPPD